MKKLASLLLTAAMLVSLAACGGESTGGNDTPENASDQNTTEAVYTIGILQQLEHPALDAATEGFQDAVSEKLGDRVTFDYKNAQDDPSNCTTIAAKFVSDEVDLIMANATTALQNAASATGTIPIVGTSITDYVAAGVIESADAPGGNVTGASDLAPIDEQIELLLELCPDVQRVGIFYCSGEVNSVYQAEKAQEILNAKGIDNGLYTFADSNDIQSVLASMINDVDVVYIPTDNKAADNMELIHNITVPAGIPVINGEENACASGGLATLSISYYSMGYQAGLIAVEILENGADPATTPIAYSSEVTKKYNPIVAEELGWEIPDGLEPIE